MQRDLTAIQQALKKYGLDFSSENIQSSLKIIQDSQKYFSVVEQQAMLIKLLDEWEKKKDGKIITLTSEACALKSGLCVTTFGIMSVDWPGLFSTCLGIINEMGWNIYFVKGISMDRHQESLGIVLIGVRTNKETPHQQLLAQTRIIQEKFKQAAVGTQAKTYLISEEFRKLEMYSQVIAYIEKNYHKKDINKIIGMNGEAVKYFAARSRDYIENRKVKDIAEQIIRNYTFIRKVHKTGKNIKLDISNFTTETEGAFTGVTVAGPTHMLNLEDCLKTIELTIPNFQLKHNREFSTEHGISLFRIEFVDDSGNPLSGLERKRLRRAFSTMVLNKRRDRAQWIESIGGFEQYARAIIPLLVREVEQTGKTQVYQSVGQATDLFIDFKVIVVTPTSKESRKKMVTDTVNNIETEKGFHIHSVKPPKTFGKADVFIIDLRANLVDIEDTETIYKTIKEKIFQALGDFRDFDEGMRTMDTVKLKAIRERLKDVNKSLIRELYYSIEDFFRISATSEEIVSHISIALEMMKEIHEKPDDKSIHIIHRQTGNLSKTGDLIPTATLFCIAYPHPKFLIQKILEIFEPYEVTLSRIEKSGKDILICRVTQNEKALSVRLEKNLSKKLKNIRSDQTA